MLMLEMEGENGSQMIKLIHFRSEIVNFTEKKKKIPHELVSLICLPSNIYLLRCESVRTHFPTTEFVDVTFAIIAGRF